MSSLFGIGAGSASTGFYSETIDQSLRFNSGSNSRMSVTVGDGSGSGGGNRRTYTLSVWIKRTNPSGADRIFEGYTSASQYTGLGFDSSGRLRFDRSQDGVTNTVYSNSVFRDATNWYHVVWAIDTEQSTASNRVRFYVNGTEITDKGSSGSGYPAEDLNTIINLSGQSTVHAIGKFGGSTGANFDGYMAEMNFIDGTQLTPSSFGETKNGVWIPKSVSGLTYGTLGFRLTFADSSDLGNNANSTDGTNDFTTISNIDSTDVVLDSPTNNWCTWNASNNFGIGNLTEGATKWAVTGSATNEGVDSTFAMPTTGKWYWEYHAQDKGYLSHIGLTSAGTVLDNTGTSDGTRASWSFGTWHATYNGNNSKYTSTAGGSTGSTWSIGNVTDGQVLGCAYDADNGTLWFSRAGTFLNSSGTANPATNTDPRFSGLNDGTQWFAYNSQYASGSPDFFVNFGQDSSFAGSKTSGSSNAQDDNGIGDFYYTPPSGFLALCASNLPQNTLSANQIEQATNHFNTITYDGDGNTTHNITGVGFQPDWTWIKERTSTSGHGIQDSSRGYENFLSNANNQSSTGIINSVLSDGFQTNNSGVTNQSGQSYIAWNWKVGGTSPTKTYKVVVVSDSGNKYRFRNSADSATFAQSAVALDLQEGGTYVFDWSDSSAQGHPFRFSTTSDGTHGGGSEYTTGVVKDDSAYTTTITVASSAPQLYYYCSIHSGMGGSVSTNSTFGSTNFDGSILSVEQSNTTSGVSILTYTGTGTQSDTVGHGLGVKPKAVLVKSTSEAQNWHVYHEGVHGSAPHNYVLVLNSNNDRSSSSSGYWGGNAPTTTVMGVGNDNSSNKNGTSYVMYLFAEVEGFSRFSDYLSIFNTDGNFIFTGFRPQWVMIKAYAGVSDASWIIYDDVRDEDNYLENYLFANLSNAEATNSNLRIDFLSNGFKIRGTNTNIGGSGDYYVFFAFARQDFKFSNAR